MLNFLKERNPEYARAVTTNNQTLVWVFAKDIPEIEKVFLCSSEIVGASEIESKAMLFLVLKPETDRVRKSDVAYRLKEAVWLQSWKALEILFKWFDLNPVLEHKAESEWTLLYQKA